MKNTLLLLILILSGCSPKIKSNLQSQHKSLGFDERVHVLGLYEEELKEGEYLGEVNVKDSGFSTKCSYNEVIEKAVLEARASGANVLKITEHKLPGISSSCHRIKAKAYKVADLENLSKEEEPIHEGDFAIINIYRFNGVGPVVSYNLKLDEEILCKVLNNYKTSVKVSGEGQKILWAKTEARSEMPIDILHGRTYYLRCSVGMGAFVGRPILELVDTKTGKAEFENFKAKRQ